MPFFLLLCVVLYCFLPSAVFLGRICSMDFFHASKFPAKCWHHRLFCSRFSIVCFWEKETARPEAEFICMKKIIICIKNYLYDMNVLSSSSSSLLLLKCGHFSSEWYTRRPFSVERHSSFLSVCFYGTWLIRCDRKIVIVYFARVIYQF